MDMTNIGTRAAWGGCLRSSIHIAPESSALSAHALRPQGRSPIDFTFAGENCALSPCNFACNLLRLAVDVLVYSHAEINQQQDACSTAVYWALREGKVLYGTAH